MLKPLISPEWLRKQVDFSEKAKGQGTDNDKRLISAANVIFSIWLGRKWFGKRLPNHKFFKPDRLGLETDPFLTQGVISDLADDLFKMQRIDGIEYVAARIKRGSRLSDDIAELAGASLLERAGIKFKFIKPTGKRGADYDVEATLGDVRVCFEMKAKIGAPSVQTIVQTIRDTGDQVPTNTPNVVVIQLPRAWLTSKEGWEALEGGIKEYFRKWNHFACVVIHGEEWRPLYREGAEVGAVFRRRHEIYLHPKPAVPFPVAGKRWLDESERDWQGIQEAIAPPDYLRYMEQVRESFAQHIIQEENRRSNKEHEDRSNAT